MAVLYQSINQLHVVLIFVIVKEAKNLCNKAVPSGCFHLPLKLLGEFFVLNYLLCLRFDKNTGCDLCF